jgi:hypothetical protein
MYIKGAQNSFVICYVYVYKKIILPFNVLVMYRGYSVLLMFPQYVLDMPQ